MPYLSFDINADYSELIRLQQEIAKTKTQMQNFRPGQSGASIDALNAKLAESTARYRQLSLAAIQSGAAMELGIRQNLSNIFTKANEIQNMLTRPMMAVGGLAGVYGLGEFLSKITSIRGQFQQMNASIETMIGKRKGEQLNAQLQEFAKISPLEFAPTVSTAQMMLGFGIDAEKVPRYLQAIGDIAMGDTRRFQSLSLAFSQMSAAGKLMGQDLLQMVNAGFQPLQVISEKTGKSIGTLKEEMSQGKISAEMVQEAFIQATSEGGKYYKMSETASQTLPGAMAKLNDSVSLMFNDMGKNMEGALVGIVNAASAIVENVERMLPILATAAAAFGVYKTSVMLSSFGAKQSVIQASQGIIDGFDAELKKLKEMQRAKKMEGYDDDIRTSLDKGAIDETYANQIQQGRIWQREQERIAENERRIAEEAQKTYEAHLKDMETQRYQSGRGLDSDINEANFNGNISGDYADRLQNERDYAQSLVDTKKAALDSAEVQKKACDQLVDSANARVESAKELMEMAEATGDADDKRAAAQEYLAAVEEQSTALTAQQSAAEGVNTAKKELNSAVTTQQAVIKQTEIAAVRGETTVTNNNTGATDRNTLAKKKGFVASALSAAGDKTAAIAKSALTAATKACTKAWNGLKAAFVSNPIGFIITAVTTLVGLFMSWDKATEQTSEAVERFGESAVKTKTNVEVLYAVLASVNKDSKAFKDALNELTGIAKDYGIVLNDESDKYGQLIGQREKLIQLIIEEGRQRQLANRIAAHQTRIDAAGTNFENEAKENIADESSGRAKEYSATFAQIIRSTLENREEEISKMIEEQQERWKNLPANATDQMKRELQFKDAEITRQIGEIIASDAKVFAANRGMVEEFDVDIFNLGEQAEKYINKVKVERKALEVEVQQQRQSQASTEANTPKPEFSAKGMDAEELAKSFKKYNAELTEINKTEVKPTVNTSEIDKAKQSAGDAKEEVGKLDASSATPTVDSTQADNLKTKTNTATVLLGKLDKFKASPTIKTLGIDKFATTIDGLWMKLQKMGGVENPKSLLSGNKEEKPKTKGQEARENIEKIKQEYTVQVNSAKTSEQMDKHRKAIKQIMDGLDQSSADWNFFDSLLDKLDKKDKSKNKDKDGVPQRAYERRKALLDEEKRTAELVQAERNRQRELEISRMAETSEKEIAQIKFNADKKRQALEKELQKEAETLEKNALQQWLKGGRDRKEFQYYNQFSASQLQTMREGYTNQARKNIGYDTQTALIDTNEATDIDKVNRKDAEAMREYLKEYGTFQQKRLALKEEYEEKIKKAENEGSRLKFQKELHNLTVQADKDAYMEMLQEFGAYNEKKLALKVRYDKLMQSSSPAETERLKLQYNRELEALDVENNTAFKNAGINPAVFEYLDNLNLSVLDELRTKLMGLISDVTASPQAIQEAATKLNAVSTAIGNRKGFWQSILNPNSGAQSNKIETEASVAQTVADTLRQKSDEANAELDQTIQELILVLQGKGVNVTSDQIANGEVNPTDFADLFSGDQSGTFLTLLSKYGAKRAEASKASNEADQAKGKADGIKEAIGGNLMSSLDGVGAIVHGVNQNIQSAVELIDNLGLSETEFGKGFKDFADTAQYATKAFDALKSGDFMGAISNLNSAFGSLGKVLGRLGIGGMGDSDINLSRDIQRLTATNEALRNAITGLEDEMSKAATADVDALYQKQKSFIEEAMNNTQNLMKRSGAAHDDGFVGIGGKSSTNRKIDAGMGWGDWARISNVVGKTVNGAADFWNLTSEQMAKVATHAPDLYAKIKALADDGHADAAQFMDEYIEYYKEIEALENARRERLTDVSFDSIKDEFKSMLLDMESDSEDFANSFEKMMQQAVINSLMNSKYNKLIQTWYNEFSEAMKNGKLTKEEQEKLNQSWNDIVDAATQERDNLKQAMGWKGSATQQSSSRSLQGMSEDTGNAIEGRLTALQIAVESIRSSESSHTISLANMTDELLQIAMEYSRFNVYQDNVERQLAKIYIELQTISENTGAIVKPIQTMQADIAEIKRNTKKL